MKEPNFKTKEKNYALVSTSFYGYITGIKSKATGKWLALKYGKEKILGYRVEHQQAKSKHIVERLHTFHFPSERVANNAETECRRIFQKEAQQMYGRKGKLTEAEFSDGHSETTLTMNYQLIVDIYEKHGGIVIC